MGRQFGNGIRVEPVDHQGHSFVIGVMPFEFVTQSHQSLSSTGQQVRGGLFVGHIAYVVRSAVDAGRDIDQVRVAFVVVAIDDDGDDDDDDDDEGGP